MQNKKKKEKITTYKIIKVENTFCCRFFFIDLIVGSRLKKFEN